MDWKALLTVFGTIFVAELGDKTQLATLLFAADRTVNKWLVFAGASFALIAASALGVLAGAGISHYVGGTCSERWPVSASLPLESGR